MIYSVKKGLVSVTAENIEESIALLRVTVKTETTQEPKRKNKKHEKHMYIKKCEFCGEEFKGRLGLAVHVSKRHQLSSALHTGSYAPVV